MSFQTGDVITRVHDERRYLIEDKTAAFWDLAFWGHPAWLDSDSNTLSTPAVTYLVMYHRMNIARDKSTVAEIIGGVRGVIPDSKLAKYGDYRYETTFENMYRNTEDIKEEQLSVEKKEYIESQKRLCDSKPLDFETAQDDSAYHSEKESEFKVKKSLNDWLNKIKNVLEGVKRISGVEEKSLDSWTEELIKTCLRFIYVARINDSLLKIMNSEISFITDYEQFPKEPISRTELLSLPQPELDEEFIMDLKEIDTLWLKLVSPNVRKIWSNQNKTFPGHTEEPSENQQSSLITVNFLRRFRQRKNSSECPSERIDVPKDIAVGLLGSLLDIIEETSMESSSGQSVAETEHKSYFPQAHGDWTKQLFPRRMNLKPLERDTSTAIKRTGVQNVTGKAPIPELPSKVDAMVPPEGLIMPIRFYMCVPPPPLASAIRTHAIVRQQQYAICQPRNSMVKVSTSHPTPQQVQGKVPLVPMTCIPPQGFIQTPAPINNWNYKCSQKANTPMQTNPLYPRINTGVFYQQIHSKDVSDISKLHSKRDMGGLENIITRRNEAMNSKWEKGMKENSDLKFPNGCGWMADKPLLQANCSTNVRFRLYQNITKSCNAIQPAVYENCNQKVVSNIYDIKPKPQLQIRGPGMAMNINNNGLKLIRLPALGIQHKLSPRSQTTNPFTHKPRFMGGITVNDLKLAQERSFYQKSNAKDNHKGILINNFVLNKEDNCATCEEKVEKWLETVNYYMKSESCVNIEELPGPPLIEISSNCVINGDAESVEWRNNEYEIENNSTKILNAFSEKKCRAHARTFAKYKKKDVRQLIVNQFVLFQGSLKLKKGNDLEGKVKLLNRYFAELNLRGMRCNLKNKIRNIKFDKSLTENKRKETASKNKCLSVFGTKREDLSLPSRDYFEIPCGFSKSNINEFKTLCRESNEFNAFPSKRMKICSSMSLFLDREQWAYNELKGKISSISYFDILTDELFFSAKDPNAEINENPSLNTKKITGWAHFKIVIKTILRNILVTLKKENARK